MLGPGFCYRLGRPSGAITLAGVAVVTLGACASTKSDEAAAGMGSLKDVPQAAALVEPAVWRTDTSLAEAEWGVTKTTYAAPPPSERPRSRRSAVKLEVPEPVAAAPSVDTMASPSPSTTVTRPEVPPAEVGEECQPGDKACEERLIAFLAADPQRNWIKKAPSAYDFATGVRVLAFRVLQPELTCEELSKGVAEADAIISGRIGTNAPQSEEWASSHKLKGVQLLATVIKAELETEMKRRC